MPTLRRPKSVRQNTRFRSRVFSKPTMSMFKRRIQTLRAKSNNGVQSVNELGDELYKNPKTRRAKVQIDRCAKYNSIKKGFLEALKIATRIGGTLALMYVVSTFAKKADFVKTKAKAEANTKAEAQEQQDEKVEKEEDEVEEEEDEVTLGEEQERLLVRMNKYLHLARTNMRKFDKKTGHWAWWAFPTETRGKSEPPPSTCVTKQTAKTVIKRAPKIWRKLLELVCELAEKKGKDVLPSIDHRRVKQFIRFWEKVEGQPKWMQSVLMRLKRVYLP